MSLEQKYTQMYTSPTRCLQTLLSDREQQLSRVPITGKAIFWDYKPTSAHGDGDVDTQVAVVGKQVGDRSIEYKTVTVHDGGRNAIVNGARCGLPREPPAVAVQLKAVGEVLRLFSRANEQHDGKELLVSFVLFLLF